MRSFSRTTQFKKDVKRCLKRGFDGTKLKRAMESLIDEKQLSEAMRDHPLRGNWKGSRDCHIEPDWILIYRIDGDHLTFERTGTHADIF